MYRKEKKCTQKYKGSNSVLMKCNGYTDCSVCAATKIKVVGEKLKKFILVFNLSTLLRYSRENNS